MYVGAPTVDEASGVWKIQSVQTMRDIGVVCFAYAATNLIYYLCTYSVVSHSDTAAGEVWLWAVSVGALWAVPRFVQMLGGWTVEDDGSVRARLRCFAVEESQWICCYCIWYSWYDDVMLMDGASDAFQELEQPWYGIVQCLFAILLSVTPAIAISGIWTMWFKFRNQGSASAGCTNTPIGDERKALSSPAGSPTERFMSEAFVQSPLNS